MGRQTYCSTMSATLPIPIAMDLGLADRIADGLHSVLARIRKHCASDTPEVQRLVDQASRYHGKMFRPALALLAGLAADPKRRVDTSDEHVTVAAVLELIHLATLVHDDVLDDASERRGHASVNAMSGNERAIILGDYLFARSYHLCSTLADQSVALRVGEITAEVCRGEMLQLARRGDTSVTEETYFKIIDGKTAALIAAASELGARASGADLETRGSLMRFGRNVGLAFQIRDDVLDLVADAETFGKPVGMDVEKGKMTLPLIHHLKAMPPDDRPPFEDLIHRSNRVTGAGRRQLVEDLESTGSISYAEDVARGLLVSARGELSGLAASSARDALLAIAEASVERSR